MNFSLFQRSKQWVGERLFLSALLITISAIVVATAHTLLSRRPLGIGFSIFTLISCVVFIKTLYLVKKEVNPRALLFFIPTLIFATIIAIRENDLVRVFSTIGIFVSFGVASFWYVAPAEALWKAHTFFPVRIFKNAFAWLQQTFVNFKELSEKNAISKFGVGILFALPALVVFFVLFLSADKVFEHAVTGIITFNGLGKILRWVAIFMVGAGYLRLMKKESEPLPEPRDYVVDHTVTAIMLGALNALFLAFLYFQVRYLFGGASAVVSLGISYATYARSGFFQLVVASGLVWLLLSFGYSFFRRSTVTRMLGIALVVQTLVIAASAVKRLLLYVDAFGLTDDRIVALFGAATIAIILAAYIVTYATANRSPWIRRFEFIMVAVSVLTLSSLNMDAISARHNLTQYIKRAEPKEFDKGFYLYRLSVDALPVYAQFLSSQIDPKMRADLESVVSAKKEEVRHTSDWRTWTLSAYRARK